MEIVFMSLYLNNTIFFLKKQKWKNNRWVHTMLMDMLDSVALVLNIVGAFM